MFQAPKQLDASAGGLLGRAAPPEATMMPDLSGLTDAEVSTVRIFNQNTPSVVNIANLAPARTRCASRSYLFASVNGHITQNLHAETAGGSTHIDYHLHTGDQNLYWILQVLSHTARACITQLRRVRFCFIHHVLDHSLCFLS